MWRGKEGVVKSASRLVRPQRRLSSSHLEVMSSLSTAIIPVSHACIRGSAVALTSQTLLDVCLGSVFMLLVCTIPLAI